MPRLEGITLAEMRLIWQLRCGYSAAAPRLIRHHLVVMRLDGGYAAVNWVASFLPRIFTELGTDFREIVFICAMFCVICVFYYRIGSEGIQSKKVERAGGEARVLLAGG